MRSIGRTPSSRRRRASSIEMVDVNGRMAMIAGRRTEDLSDLAFIGLWLAD